jgi:predicted transcriptional regulator
VEKPAKAGRPVRTSRRIAVTWRLPINLLFRLDAVAEAAGVTTTEWVERAITSSLESRSVRTPLI